jgi:RNA polymerase sigma factor (sigma-70 family)
LPSGEPTRSPEASPATTARKTPGSGPPSAPTQDAAPPFPEEASPAASTTHGLLRDKIESLLKTLTYREREIIRLRYGLTDGYTYTLEEVGRIFRVTRERVRQIEAKAVKKLQHPVRARQLENFMEPSVG